MHHVARPKSPTGCRPPRCRPWVVSCRVVAWPGVVSLHPHPPIHSSAAWANWAIEPDCPFPYPFTRPCRCHTRLRPASCSYIHVTLFLLLLLEYILTACLPACLPAHRGLLMRHDCNPLHPAALGHTLHTLGPQLTDYAHYSIQLTLLTYSTLPYQHLFRREPPCDGLPRHDVATRRDKWCAGWLPLPPHWPWLPRTGPLHGRPAFPSQWRPRHHHP